MKKSLLFFFSFYLFTHSFAQVQVMVAGPENGRAFSNAPLAGSEQSWINTQNARASDGQYVTFGNLSDVAGSHTDYLVTKGFIFNIPAASQIVGIVAYVESSDLNATTADYNIRIVKNGVIGTTERSSGELYSSEGTQGVYRSYGSKTNLWGETWTVDDIKSADFGIAIAAQRAVTGKATTGRIDDIRITVYYTDLSTLPVNLSAFSATPKKDLVRLEWTTTDESGMDRFEIQRSNGNTEFKTFGTIICRNQVAVNSYGFNDYAPFQGVSSYRLKILEKSGSVMYSKIITVQLKNDNANTMFPSPWKNGQSLFIRNPVNEKLVIQFYDSAGEIVAKVSTSSVRVVMPALTNVKGILHYKVFDEKEKLTGSGSLLVY